MTTEYEKNDSAGKLKSNDVHTYFSQINPIAERIAKAISDTKTTYGMLWYTLNSNDQDDILNETLIKPELTLQYIDSLALKRSLSSSSLSNAIKDTISKEKNAKELGNSYATNNQQYYGFDGRSLSSFAIHRVAQKLLKDDTLADAGYRDEHSAPFSYRTRSQINFHLDNNADNLNKHNDLSLSLNSTKTINDLNAPPTKPTTTTTTKNHISAIKKPKRLAPSKPAQITQKEEIQKSDFLAANFAVSTYTSYSPVQHDDEESSSLIPRQVIDQKDAVVVSKKNTTLEDDDDEHEYYNDANHDQMEEVKLLDAHVSLKRGFEFLNNW